MKNSEQNTVIKVENLSKRYKIRKGHIRQDTFRDLLAHSVKTIFKPDKRLHNDRKESFWALKDVSFEVKKGENLGIIGLNGAGKSTLLKVLSRITVPTRGYGRINGRLGSLLEVGTGFHAELTGRENIYLYGAILGMTKKTINKKFDRIVEFSEVEEFIDTPVKRYSSGMYVRLAFSVAAHLEPEILLIDEVLSVGDLPFQKKCIDFAKGLEKGEGTILFVSHNMFSIKNMCSRVIYIKQGRVIFDGETEEGIKLYEEDCKLSVLDFAEKDTSEWPIRITDAILLDEDGDPKSMFEFGEPMRLQLRFETREAVEDPNFIVAFIRSDGLPCCNFSTELDGFNLGTLDGTSTIELRIPQLKLVSERYNIIVIIRKKGFQQVLCTQIAMTFHVKHDVLDLNFGVFHEPAEWAWKGSNKELLTNQLR